MGRRPLPDRVRFPVTVLQDSNEVAHEVQYTFLNLRADAGQGGVPMEVTTRPHNLLWGDYSLEGYESSASVERKTLGDLFGTLGKGRERFEAELEALNGYRLAEVVVEANWEDIWLKPPPFSLMAPKAVGRTVLAYKVRYRNVHWTFASSRVLAERTTFRLLEKFWQEGLPERERRRLRYPEA